MRFLRRMSLVALATSMALAQTTTPVGQAKDSSVADELKALKDALAAQQQAMAAQQAQIAQQQQKIEDLEKSLSEKTAVAPHVENAALTTNTAPATAVMQGDKPQESPLSFRIGGTDFTPGGFVDFENIFRTTNTGNVTATNFWAIPFNTSPAAHLTEYRSTGQYSRFNLKIAGKYGANNVTGYIESDFNGNDAQNVFVSSNPHTFRLRLYWVDLKRDKWEFLGGSTWGLQTPNKTGISPMPSDLALTYGEDSQTHVGLNYTRAAEFRAGYHFNDRWVWAVAVQNPQQFIGPTQTIGGTTFPEVIFPAQFSSPLGSQFDNTTAGAGTPNLAPDFITKVAFDDSFSGKPAHLELGALTTTAKITVQPIANGAFSSHSKLGGGLLAAFNVEPVKNVRLLASGMWGDGVGRYLLGMGPQAVVVPIPAVAGGTCAAGVIGSCNANISMVHAGDLLFGAEIQPRPKTQLGVYYGGAYFRRNAFPDLTAPGVVKPIIGFGGIGEAGASIMNRAIQEATLDWTQTFWRNPQYGAVLLVTQTSYVTRSPWFVPAGAPKNAHLTMGYLSLRYVLP
jgi:uncharacterized coiled-coil protein SlyX